jgi:F-type H+-transporting ATPase subunit a
MDLHVSVKAETLWKLGPFNFTNSFLMMLVIMALIVLVGALIARKATVIPGRAQSGFEVVAEFVLNLVESTAGKRAGRRIFPLIGALFFFIIISNYSGLLPLVGTIGNYENEAVEPTTALVASTSQPTDASTVAAADEAHTEKVLRPWFRSPNADLNMTLAMALLTFFIVQVAGISAHGFIGRIKHMADPPFLFPIEAVSELSRIVSLSFRLFGNIFAGEVLVTVMFTMVAAIGNLTFYGGYIAAPIATVFLFLEVLFGFIQALVFALLTLIYITLAVSGGHDDEHEHADAGHGAQSLPAGAGGD